VSFLFQVRAKFRSWPAGKYREQLWLLSQLLPGEPAAIPRIAGTPGCSADSDGRNLRAVLPPGWSAPRTTINAVPIYEFECRSCGHRFEELVGSHVGRETSEVRCPQCESSEMERLVSTSYAPLHRRLTPNQKRRLEKKRGIDRGGAKERFKRQRAAEKRSRGRGG
jgi:putative FmdB family regulatory protein